MTDLEDAVRNEVEELHRFFVAWFAGEVDKAELESRFVPHLEDDLLYITPDGNRIGHDGLLEMIRGAHGANADFRIQVRDVRILRDLGDHLIVTYSEWQKQARFSEPSNNARFTTAILTKARPFKWLHIHETSLPEAERGADPFDF